jgi:DNA-binding MarR family transcriptional regulator
MRRPVEDSAESSRIMLGLLDAVEQDRVHSQRHLASELGIALGLVNAYLKRCIKKGLVKVRQAPARRYAYYLTPQGFAEKSRLTVEYFSYSFEFFREAKTDASSLLHSAKLRGVRSMLLVGHSDLAEIAALCAMEQGVRLAGLVDHQAEGAFVGTPIFRTIDAVDVAFDAVMITELKNAASACEAAVALFGKERVLVPQLLRMRASHQTGGKA